MDEQQYIDNQQLLQNVINQKRYGFIMQTIEFASNKLTVHCAAMARNQEMIACGCGKSIVMLYDLINKQSVTSQNTMNIQFRRNQITSIQFSHYYDYLLAGNSNGDLMIYQIKIGLIGGEFTLNLIRYLPNLQNMAIHYIHCTSFDHTLTIAQNKFSVHLLSDLIGSTQQPQAVIDDKIQGVLTAKLVYFNYGYNLYMGTKDGQIIQFKLTSFDTKGKGSVVLFNLNATISTLDVTNDTSLMAVAYQKNTEDGHLNIYYMKRLKPILQLSNVATQKVSQLSFFNDKTHIIVGSWDGSFKIVDIKLKQVVNKYTQQQLHPLGLIAMFQTQDVGQFSNLITVGQEHKIIKVYFGNSKEALFDYIPFIFWVELRIRQELQFHSDLLDYLKLLFIETVGIDLVKRKEQNVSAIGFQIFGPLLKRVIDYDDYRTRNPVLFSKYNQDNSQIHQEVKKLQSKQISLKPIDKQGSQQQEIERQQSNIQEFPFLHTQQQQHMLLFNKIMDSIDYSRIQILNLQKCPFLFDQKLPFYEALLISFSRIKSLKYLDLSFNKLKLDTVLQILNSFSNATKLEFLSLAHNQLGANGGQSQLTADVVIQLMDNLVSLSLRANQFSDYEGELILNQIKYFKKLKILDLSGNLEFAGQTLLALQRITILKNKIEFAQQRNDIQNFIGKMKMIQDKLLQDDAIEDEMIQGKHQPKEASENIQEDERLIEMVNPGDGATIDRQSSIMSSESQIVTCMSLQLLCIQFKPERCEEGMKTATDFLVQRKITNLYIYVVDNKQDQVWESSISVFYTRDLFRITDYISTLFFSCVGTMSQCCEQFYRVLSVDTLYCIKQIFTTTICIYKYMLCSLCTFLTSRLGRVIVKIFGVEESTFQYTPKKEILEQMLEQNKVRLFLGVGFYNIAYYISIVILPFYFVKDCAGQDWNGHLIYLAFAIFSFIFEGAFGTIINATHVTTNEYTEGTKLSRLLYISKDLLISQLNKFQLYTCICFIVVIESCQPNSIIAYCGVAIILLNLLIDHILGISHIYACYNSNLQDKYIDVFSRISTHYQMTLVVNLLVKWSQRNVITILCLKDMPQNVFTAIYKAFLQDIPLLLLQIIQYILYPETEVIGILMVSLIICIIHGAFSTVKMLSIIKLSRIDEIVMMHQVTQQQLQLPTQHKSDNKELLFNYLTSFKAKISSHFNYIFMRNSQTYDALVDSVQHYESVTQIRDQQPNQNKRQSQVAPLGGMRKGITIMGNKVPRMKVKQSAMGSSYQKVSIHAALDIMGSQTSTWQLSEVSNEVAEVLLVDVPRKLFSYQLEWDDAPKFDQYNCISSLKSEILGINAAYNHFQLCTNPIILDLGFGSGYITFVLAALALKCPQNQHITIYALDHYDNCERLFQEKLLRNFKWMQLKCTFHLITMDCMYEMSKLNNLQFDYIHIGFAITKWKFNKEILPLCNGVVFGYEIVCQSQQNGFIYTKTGNQMTYLPQLKLIDYTTISPLAITKLDFNAKIPIIQQNECAMCLKPIDPSEAQFINHYWGESICFACGTKDLEEQGEQIDIDKLQIKSNVLFWAGGDPMDLSKVQTTNLMQNAKQKIGQRKVEDRSHKVRCKGCNELKVFGFMYICTCCVPQINYCNKCGVGLMNKSLKLSVKCSYSHVFLRQVFCQQTK